MSCCRFCNTSPACNDYINYGLLWYVIPCTQVELTVPSDLFFWTFVCSLNNKEGTLGHIFRIMLLLHFDNMAEPLSWEVTPVTIWQAIKDYLVAARLVEQQQISTHPSVILILMGNQFGFRKGIANEDAIFKLTNEMLNALNSKTMDGSICCDLGKVFDFVSKLS